MKSLLAFLTALGIASSSFGAGPALALVKKNPVSTTPGAGAKAVALTKGECTTFGGNVSDSATCKSGSMCTTKDENGKDHHVCISATKK